MAETTTKTPAATPEADKPKRTRKPTAFKQSIRLSLFGHSGLTSALPAAKAFGEAIVAAGILNGPDEATPNALRVVARERKGSKSSIKSVSIYVAANGFEFAADEEFVRINNDVWDQLRPQLEALGLTADEDGLKALAAILAANQPTPAPATPAAS